MGQEGRGEEEGGGQDGRGGGRVGKDLDCSARGRTVVVGLTDPLGFSAHLGQERGREEEGNQVCSRNNAPKSQRQEPSDKGCGRS